MHLRFVELQFCGTLALLRSDFARAAPCRQPMSVRLSKTEADVICTQSLHHAQFTGEAAGMQKKVILLQANYHLLNSLVQRSGMHHPLKGVAKTA